ncbi:rod shape-determining protein [Patescibacteria group bacterium]|nr:rod shape-determining protein [Patescibacteria group bacterium]
MILKKTIGVDLGTDTTQIYLKGVGIILNEPSIVAFNNRTNRVVAVGLEAKRMLSRTPSHVTALRPITNGVIADFDMAKEMVQRFMKTKSLPWSWLTETIVGVPTNLTEVERKSVEDLFKEVGVSKVYLVEEPIAAAVGSGLDITKPTAHFIVDIGAGTTDMAIISMNGIVVSRRLKIAGDYLNQEIIRGVKDELKLFIGEPTAEEIKIAVGSAVTQSEKLDISIRGRDAVSGLPKEANVRDTQVRYWLSKPIKIMVEALKELIDITPPELAGDIYKNGVYLCGGGSMLRGMSQLFQKELGVDVHLVDEPLLCVVRGIGLIAENPGFYGNVLESFSSPLSASI